MDQIIFELRTEQQTERLAYHLANHYKAHNVSPAKIYLSGNLGAGKTTFARFFLQALGVTERIKSPTYTVIEPYFIGEKTIYHIDLYRINAHEIYDLGFLEEEGALWLIEWPEKGAGVLPDADLHLTFTHQEIVSVVIVSNTVIGEQIALHAGRVFD